MTLRLTEAEYADLRKRGKAAPTVPAKVAAQSKLELRFEHQLQFGGFPPHVRNYHFIPGRDFELDFAWPMRKVGVSIEGMAHRVKGRFKADIEKHALGLIAGWKILRVGGHEIRHEIAIRWLREVIG